MITQGAHLHSHRNSGTDHTFEVERRSLRRGKDQRCTHRHHGDAREPPSRGHFPVLNEVFIDPSSAIVNPTPSSSPGGALL